MMEVNEGNTYITEHDRAYTVNIQMPDGSRNYLHCKSTDLESCLIIRDLINECSVDHMNLRIEKYSDNYFRLILTIEDCNKDRHVFHSRKLNLNDVVYERMQLLVAE